MWCPADDFFMAPTTGETFDIAGRAMSGPAPRNMDRVRVVVHPSTVGVPDAVLVPGRGLEVRDCPMNCVPTSRLRVRLIAHRAGAWQVIEEGLEPG
jgi:hypothetical protein